MSIAKRYEKQPWTQLCSHKHINMPLRSRNYSNLGARKLMKGGGDTCPAFTESSVSFLLAISTHLCWKFISLICMRIKVHQLGGRQKKNFHGFWQHVAGVKGGNTPLICFSRTKPAISMKIGLIFFFNPCVPNHTIQDLIVQLLCESPCLKKDKCSCLYKLEGDPQLGTRRS